MTHKETIFPKLVIVIPALDEEKSIGHVMDEISKIFHAKDYSVIVVDGNSEDATADIARKKGAIVIGQKDTGYGDALLSGFIYAVEELDPLIIAMMDGDMTYDPKDILALMYPILEDNVDLAIGNRFMGIEEGAMTTINMIGNRILSWICRVLFNLNTYDTQCGLRVFKADIVSKLTLTKKGMPFATEMLAKARFAGLKIHEVPISYRPRIGKAKLVPLEDGIKIFHTILGLMFKRRIFSLNND